jgi:hypothetical protein
MIIRTCYQTSIEPIVSKILFSNNLYRKKLESNDIEEYFEEDMLTSLLKEIIFNKKKQKFLDKWVMKKIDNEIKIVW